MDSDRNLFVLLKRNRGRSLGLLLIAAGGTAIALALAGGGPDRPAQAQAPAAPGAPNFVVVMTDDQRVSDLRVMKRTRRELIRKGTTFENYLASFPLCCPARATLLSGQYAHNHGIYANRGPDGGFESFDDDGSLPQALQAGGYNTAFLGKYLNGYGKRDLEEVPRGWSKWAAPVRRNHFMYDYVLNHNGETTRYRERPSDYATTVYSKLALRAIGQFAKRDRPFFTVLSTLAPHSEPPVVGRPNPRPAPGDGGAFRKARLPRSKSFGERNVADKPPYLRRSALDRADRRRLLRNHRDRLTSLLAVDRAVARIIDKLRRAGELRNTYVIYMSDNGFLLGEHRERGKIDFYEESTHVPFIVRGPGVPRGEVRKAVVGNIDFAPTVLDLASAAPQRTPDGESLRPYWRNRQFGRERAVLLENRNAEGVRTRRYLYAEHHGDPGTITGYELYDLRRDPFQLKNLIGPGDTATRGNLPAGVDAADVQGTRAELAALLDQLRTCDGSQCISR